jgi:putative tricarboxylic transport membrane protein
MTGLWTALATVVSWQGLVAVVLGTSLGIIIGALPGIGPSLGIALLIPFTFNLDPAISLVLMLCLYQGAEYGGSITAVLISTPGGAAAAATVLDGYAMNRRGEGGRALGASLTASSIGGVFSAVVLVILAPLLANVALSFGPPEYFSLGLFGLGIVSSLSSDNPLKGWLVAFLGLAIVTVGVDPISGAIRFTGGRFELLEGVPFMTALIGLFAVTEVFNMIDQGNLPREVDRRLSSARLSLRDLRHIMPATLRGSVIGTVLGIIPGLGPSVAAWLAYDMERRWSKHPETFGTGEIKGVAAPEAANNAVVGGNLVPLLSLGIPSSPTAALLMGALVIHGLQPGPQLFVESPEIVYAIYAGLAASIVAMYVLGQVAIPLWTRVVEVPNTILAPLILSLALIGAYATRNLMFDVWLTLGFGVLGYVLKKYRFPLPPLVLAIVLGYTIETNFRRSLLMGEGSPMIFLERPLALVLLVVALVSVFLPLLGDLRRRRVTATDR